MAVVKAREQDIALLARLLRAEAEGEGEKGMLLVGNVGINRVRANCSDFKDIRTIPQMVFQPHAFEATLYGYFYQKARDREKNVWPKDRSMARDIGRRNSVCGISDLPVIVLRPGITSLW